MWQRKLKTLKHEQTSYAVCQFEERVTVFLLQKHFKNNPDKSRLKKTKFNVSSSNVQILHNWIIENFQQRTNSLSNRLFEGQLQFHVRKEPQNYNKLVGKEEVLAVV